MCIVSIFSDKAGNFILTQNRDESIFRPTSDEIRTREIFHQNYTGPLDLVSGGTWIFYSDLVVCCILNGGYIKHSHRPHYRLSRGLVILEVLKYPDFEKFSDEIDLDEIEPFTMIMLQRISGEKKILVWDGIQKYKEDVSHTNLIVRSSSTLYTESEKRMHEAVFENLNKKDPESIFKLQKELRMKKNEKFPTVQTTSISQIIQQNSKIDLKFCPITN